MLAITVYITENEPVGRQSAKQQDGNIEQEGQYRKARRRAEREKDR